MNALKEKAGGYWDKLRNDSRVQGFLRTVSIRVVERIRDVSQAALDRLQRADDPGRELPTAALLNLGLATRAYTRPDRDRPAGPGATAGGEVNIPHLQQMGDALKRANGLGPDGQGARASSEAAKARSTTSRKKGPKRPVGGGAGEQAGHLRRQPGSERQRGPKPGR